jgi:flagellar biosynthetic protein FlhB
MAEELDFQSRTEAPTPRRREEAYEQGKFAFSTELTSSIVLFVGIGGLALFANWSGGGLLHQTRSGLGSMPRDLPMEMVQALFGNLFVRGLFIVGALFGVLVVAALAANFAQVGFRLSGDRLSMDWDRVSPFHFERLLSWAKIVHGLVLIVKILAVGTVAWWILRTRAGEIAMHTDMALATSLASSWDLILRLALGMGGTLVLIGAIDYAWQRWRFERSLYMTKQELKDELKREEGDPQIKARIRKMQRETAQRKMFREVPRATVVVTNPTHLAVALRYEPGKMTAPKVVAKGAGHIAKRIVELARRHGVPVVERKPIAQALYKLVRVDKAVPMTLYLVVAELLAYVYRLKGGTTTTTGTSR